MAFFKFRKGGDDQPTAAAPLESAEAMRRRAKHRLIGAVILVLIGVIGFPLLFDATPRPIPVDIPIEIPDKAKAKPLVIPGTAPAAAAAPAAPAAVVTEPVVPEAKPEPKAPVKAEAKPEPKVEPKAEAKAPAKPEPKAVAKAEPKLEAKPEPKVEAKPAPKPDDGVKAKALLEGKDTVAAAAAAAAAAAPAAADSAADSGRYVVQVGAFAEADKLRETRSKLERAGLKTYTQVVDSKEGKRTRVRVGPFANKAEADKVAEKIRKLDLPVAIFAL